ncbi:glutamate--cysteine ligase [Streptomyces sp. YIM 98790]|uniref:carboxylate-amine ligase n=1 Tax=Streptomyces sp. YIM 98790 TaxID=2689077 RepID=UPI001FB72B0A|nr:glutamate--cysteine ligase [Streptomyces sp. YIM 98790]
MTGDVMALPTGDAFEPGHATHAGMTMGVEEEYLLVDPVSHRVVSGAGDAVRHAEAALGDMVTTELGQCQVEAQTPPCTEAAELRRQIGRMRASVADAAGAAGASAIACGTAPLDGAAPLRVTGLPRYLSQSDTYRGLVAEHFICAVHVHIGIPDPERAVLVSNHLRPWIPVLSALMANSPYFAGRDTGYASWRRMLWGRWPVSGPPPYFPSLEDHDRLVDALSDSGALVDRRSLFWDIRPSTRYPTLEVRVADVPMTAEESVLFATLVRGLAVTALHAVARGDPGPPLSPDLLRAGCWRAARDGLHGQCMDPVTGGVTETGAVVDALERHIGPALEETGDRRLAGTGLRRLRAAGTGADRQRAAFRRRGRLTDVVHLLAAQTPAGDLG